MDRRHPPRGDGISEQVAPEHAPRLPAFRHPSIVSRVQFHATCPIGTERVLADELSELGLSRVKLLHAAVRFVGRWEDAWWACFTTRIAMRILHPVADFPCRGADDLYEAVRELEWEEHVSVQTTLAV